MPQKASGQVLSTNDLGLLKYAITKIGEGVQPWSKNLSFLRQVQQLAVLRYIEVYRDKFDPRMQPKKMREAMYKHRLRMIDAMAGRKAILGKAQWQLQLDLQKLALLESMEQFELFLRQIRLQGTILVAGKLKRLQDLARESPDSLREKLRDKNAETRWMAAHIVGMKRYPMETALIARLSDVDKGVQLAARQALVRLSRGNDFGPRLKASESEREQAIQQWKHWWSLQDNNAKRTIVRVAEKP